MNPASEQDPGAALLALYDVALPRVFGYLLHRCGSRDLAEELTAETWLSAAAALRSSAPDRVGVGWLVGIARHKLVDHWRRMDRQRRVLAVVAAEPDVKEPWEVTLDAVRAGAVLADLSPMHRAALILRYVDDLPIAQVAGLLDRSVSATEALLKRARARFREIYEQEDDDV